MPIDFAFALHYTPSIEEMSPIFVFQALFFTLRLAALPAVTHGRFRVASMPDGYCFFNAILQFIRFSSDKSEAK